MCSIACHGFRSSLTSQSLPPEHHGMNPYYWFPSYAMVCSIIFGIFLYCCTMLVWTSGMQTYFLSSRLCWHSRVCLVLGYSTLSLTLLQRSRYLCWVYYKSVCLIAIYWQTDWLSICRKCLRFRPLSYGSGY